MVLRTSNLVFFNALDAIPRENIGWWVEVYDINNVNTLLARIYDFESLSFKIALDEPGFGSVTLSASSEVFQGPLPNGLPATNLLDSAGWWKFIEDGVERFRGMFSMRKKNLAERLEAGTSYGPADDLAVVQVRGLAQLLEWAIVLPVSFTAEGDAQTRDFVGVTWAYVFLTLFTEAAARGAIPSWIVPMFTATNDTKNAVWTDTGNYAITPGTTLLSIIKDAADNIGFNWFMRHDGTLLAAMEFGNDYGMSVRFFEGHDIFRGDDQMDADEVFSHIYVEGGTDGAISTASDTSTATTWLRRELYINAASVADAAARGIVATSTLAKHRIAIESRKFNVIAYGKDDAGVSLGRRVFTDWTVGDTIGYGHKEIDLSTDYKVVEIGAEVNSRGQFSVEILVKNKRELALERLTVLIKRVMGGNTVAGGNTVNTVKSIVEQMTFSRTTSTVTTGTLNPGGDTFATIEMAPGYRIYSFDCNYDCRFRMYVTEFQRLADISRAIGTDPDPSEDHGLVFEFIADGGFHNADMSPMVDGFTTGGNTVPVTIDNLDTINRQITVTLTWIRTE